MYEVTSFSSRFTMLSAIDNVKIMEFNEFTKLELVHQVDLFPIHTISDLVETEWTIFVNRLAVL